MSDNYNDLAREMGYDPTDPDHVEKMQDDFAGKDDGVVTLNDKELDLLTSDEPSDDQLDEIENEQH